MNLEVNLVVNFWRLRILLKRVSVNLFLRVNLSQDLKMGICLIGPDLVAPNLVLPPGGHCAHYLWAIRIKAAHLKLRYNFFVQRYFHLTAFGTVS